MYPENLDNFERLAKNTVSLIFEWLNNGEIIEKYTIDEGNT